MLPIEYEIMAPFIKPRAKFILLSGKSKFGKMNSSDHLLERLNDFVETSKRKEVHDQYEYLQSGAPREYRNMHPDLFLKDQHRTINVMNHHFNEKVFDTHIERMFLDLPTRIHLASGGPFERWLVKCINKLDHESILTDIIRDQQDEN